MKNLIDAIIAFGLMFLIMGMFWVGRKVVQWLS
jgi:hypothetical protein